MPDLLLSSVPKTAEAFEAGRADIALLDIGELTRIKDADIVSSYCVGYNSASGVCTIAGSVPPEKIERIFYTRVLLPRVSMRVFSWGKNVAFALSRSAWILCPRRRI